MGMKGFSGGTFGSGFGAVVGAEGYVGHDDEVGAGLAEERRHLGEYGVLGAVAVEKRVGQLGVVFDLEKVVALVHWGMLGDCPWAVNGKGRP